MDLPFQVFVADTETTGLDNNLCEIIELSISHLNQDRQKTWCLKATRPNAIQLDALRINGHKLEDILHKTAEGKAKYKEPKDVMVEVENWIAEDLSPAEERILVGHNVQFDENMLRKLWSDNGSSETYPFGQRPFLLDTRQVEIFLNLLSGKKEEYYNLNSLIKKYGVKNTKQHTAAADVAATQSLLLAQMKSIQDKINV